MPPEFPGARRVEQFVAIRGSGRIELEADKAPRGWARADWGAVAVGLQSRSDRSVPALCFRVAEPEGALSVAVRRHDVADALKLRVTQGDLGTVFSATGSSMTSVQLRVDVLEKSTLRVRLPEGARLFNTFVNGEGVSVVREGDSYLFHVAPSLDGGRAADVRLAYAMDVQAGGEVNLAAPSLNVPLENLTWRVVVPPGYLLSRYKGDLQLTSERSAGMPGIEEYKGVVETRRSTDAREAVALLEKADSFLQSGDQQRAGAMLSRASNAQLDEASNEDARVQLRNLKTQQTLLGLNTRRQRLYLDNRLDSGRNEQLEQAANLNPFMRGKINFDPQQVDQLLMGNTADENTALQTIAGCIVDQQLAAEPAPAAIDVTLLERGRVLTFTRSLQVDGNAPLGLRLSLAKSGGASARLELPRDAGRRGDRGPVDPEARAGSRMNSRPSNAEKINPQPKLRMHRRNLIIGALFSISLISGVAWYGERTHWKKPARPPEPRIVVVDFPLPTPEPTELPEEKQEAAKEQVSVPSQPDTLPPHSPIKPFEQPIEPPRPQTDFQDTAKIPQDGFGGHAPMKILNLSDLDQKPIAKYQGSPEYPYSLKREGMTGEVLVAFVVDAAGNTRNVFAVRSTASGFEENACKAVSRWKFKPGRKDGRAVPVRMEVPIEFKLDS